MEVDNNNSILPNLSLPSNDSQPQATSESGNAKPANVEAINSRATSSDNSLEAENTQKQVDINALITDINEYTQNIQRNLKFSLAEESGRVVIQVFNSETEELIRQIPSEEALAISEALQNDQLEGVLLTAKT